MSMKLIIAGLVVVAGAVAALLAFVYLLPLDRWDRAPVQPIAFSHKVHAGTNAIACLFCHRYAPKSTVAGIPAVADCKECHLFISPDAPEIKKLAAYWEKGTPIPWVRVYGVADFVYFPHMMHVRAGISCAACHGDVASMERIVRRIHFKMGWCLNCHREHKASIDCWICHK